MTMSPFPEATRPFTGTATRVRWLLRHTTLGGPVHHLHPNSFNLSHRKVSRSSSGIFVRRTFNKQLARTADRRFKYRLINKVCRSLFRDIPIPNLLPRHLPNKGPSWT